MTKYAVVTVISQYRVRYAIPMDDLQKLNTDIPVELQWAEDCVLCEDVKEFSQKHLGEVIIDTVEADEDELLALFDQGHDYLQKWPREKKLEWIREWRFGSE